MSPISKIRHKKQKNECANNSSVSPALLWETIKLKIREASLNNAKQGKKERVDQTEELEKTIITLERTLEDKNIEGQLREQLLDVMRSKKEQYENIIKHRTKGAKLPVRK